LHTVRSGSWTGPPRIEHDKKIKDVDDVITVGIANTRFALDLVAEVKIPEHAVLEFTERLGGKHTGVVIEAARPHAWRALNVFASCAGPMPGAGIAKAALLLGFFKALPVAVLLEKAACANASTRDFIAGGIIAVIQPTQCIAFGFGGLGTRSIHTTRSRVCWGWRDEDQARCNQGSHHQCILLRCSETKQQRPSSQEDRHGQGRILGSQNMRSLRRSDPMDNSGDAAVGLVLGWGGMGRRSRHQARSADR